MTGEVVLSAALRNNLLSLQRTQSNIDKTQNILSTGLKVSSALDNPQSFFASQSLKDRSSDLSALLDGIGQSIQTLKTADAGVTSLTKLVEQASSIVDSARDAITNGAKEAALVGNIDLSKITSNGATGGLSALTGITGGTTELRFVIKDKDGAAVTVNNGGGGAGAVIIATGDSTEQLITKINDLVNSATGDSVVHAELTSAGKLKITGLDGATVSMYFDADGDGASETTSAADLAVANALGFGYLAATEEGGASSAAQAYNVFATALPSTKLTSGTFYREGATGYARASSLLEEVTSVDNSTAGSNVRFSAVTTGAGISITVNGTKTSAAYNIQGGTIQGLIDTINNDSQIGDLVEASYDESTGKFSIEAIDATVTTLKTNLVAAAGTTITGLVADFDFGTKLSQTTAGTATTNSETFVLASAASVLSQYEDDYNTIRTQIDELVEDTSYRGVNLLSGDTLDTYFNEDRSNKLSTAGSDLSSASLGLAAADFSRLDTIEAASDQTRAGLTALRNFGSTLANSLSVIQTRQEFTSNLINTLNEGSDKLTLADQNEEGAKLLALQTRQQLGVTALSLAAQAQQSVLRLF